MLNFSLTYGLKFCCTVYTSCQAYSKRDYMKKKFLFWYNAHVNKTSFEANFRPISNKIQLSLSLKINFDIYFEILFDFKVSYKSNFYRISYDFKNFFYC